jgi:hypothetical protein
MKIKYHSANLILTWLDSKGACLQSAPSLTGPVWTSATNLFRVVGSDATVTVPPIVGER